MIIISCLTILMCGEKKIDNFNSVFRLIKFSVWGMLIALVLFIIFIAGNNFWDIPMMYRTSFILLGVFCVGYFTI